MRTKAWGRWGLGGLLAAGLAVPAAAQEAVRVTGIVYGTVAVSFASQTSFIDWDYRQPLRNALIAILDIFSNAQAGYEFALVNLDVTQDQAFEFDLMFGGKPVEFNGNRAVLQRMAPSVGTTTSSGPQALMISAPPAGSSATVPTVRLQLVVKAP
jgi:hypothetical protein